MTCPKEGGKEARLWSSLIAARCKNNFDVTVIFALYKYVQWHVCEFIYFYFLKRMSAAISSFFLQHARQCPLRGQPG